MTRRLTHQRLTRPLLVAATLLIVASSCGGTMSPGEYVEGLNSLVAEVGPDLDASVDAYEQIADPTMDDWSGFVEREVALRRDLSAKFEALRPPDSIAEIHQILLDAIDRGQTATEALIAVAATAATPAEAESTPEFAEYVAANAEGSSIVCRQVQDELDELVVSGEQFAGEAWLSNLALTVRATLGCL